RSASLRRLFRCRYVRLPRQHTCSGTRRQKLSSVHQATMLSATPHRWRGLGARKSKQQIDRSLTIRVDRPAILGPMRNDRPPSKSALHDSAIQPRDQMQSSRSALHETLVHDTALLFAGTIILLLLVLAGSALASPPRHVDLYCHRTANQDVPENTLASLDQAALLGCDAVEVDVRRTLDGSLVLNHDG